MSERIEFTYPESSRPAPRLEEEGPFRILVLGDFAGRAARGAFSPADLSERRVHTVDLDTLDGVYRRLGAALPLPDAAEPVPFAGLDDFHPDRIVARVPALTNLLDLHRRLADPGSAAQAVQEVRDRFGAVREDDGAPSAPASSESDRATLDRLLGGPRDGSGGPRPGGVALDRLLRDAVEGHVVPAPGAAHHVYVDLVVRALAAGVSRILGGEEFRRLESAWRSLERLVRSVETGTDLSLHLLEVAREEIEADLAAAAGSMRETELFRRLGERGPGGPDRPGWSLVVLDLAFGPTEADLILLGSLGRLGAALRAPLVAGARPEVAGVASWPEATDPASWAFPEEDAARWTRLRRSDPARWLGLCAPRLLLRQPYGAASDPVEAFPFEEWPEPHERSGLLWGNGSYGCAEVVARKVLAGGSEPGDSTLEDLPACVATGRDGPALVPCAEAHLHEGAVLALLERGVMPWISDRSRPRARLVRLQSLAQPAAPLPGVPEG